MKFPLLSLLPLCLLPVFLQGEIIISEILTSNSETILDHEGDASDYIELYNAGEVLETLTGYYLTDDSGDLTQWKIPEVDLGPGAYLLIYASGKDLTDGSNEYHTNFKLSRDGEYLALVGTDGTTILDEFSPGFPEQYVDTSYGVWDGDGSLQYLVPSPGEANTVRSSALGFPEFSHPHGLYEEGFILSISSELPDSEIYYTLDGSVPNSIRGTLYDPESGIQITGTRVVRAIAKVEGGLPTLTATASYIFPADVVTQTNDQTARGFPDNWVSTRSDFNYSRKMRVADYEMDPTVGLLASDLTTIPTVSLVLPQEDLWDSENGIYINSYQTASSDSSWERVGSVEYIDPASEVTFSEEAGLRIFGGASRSPDLNDKQGFRVVFRGEYGLGRLESEMFERVGSAANEINTIVLRSHWGSSFLRDPEGAGWVGETDPWTGLYMRDVYANEIYRATGQLSSRSMMVHLYLNGLYFGLYEAIERPDDSFNAENRGGDDEDYDVIKGDSGQKDYNGIVHSGLGDNYRELFSYFDTNPRGLNLTVSEPHAITDEELAIVGEYLDLEAFCDYMISLWVINRLDFPNKNWYAASKRGEAGGPPEEPFVFFTWDSEASLYFDDSFNRRLSYDERSVAERWNLSATHDNGPVRLYRRLKLNEKFRRIWADRAFTLLTDGGPLSTENNLDRWDALALELDRAIVAETARWGDWVPSYRDSPVTRDDWFNEQRMVRDYIIAPRNEITISQMREFGIYPDLDPPEMEIGSNIVWPGEGVTLVRQGRIGQVQYTTDGTDPREGGMVYENPIMVDTPMRLQASTVEGSDWSAAVMKELVPLGGLPLAITEIMYHPGEMPGVEIEDPADLEFLEITNVGRSSISLEDVVLTGGVRFEFKTGMITELGAGESVLVVRDLEMFEQAYGNLLPVAGEYDGNLSNSGEGLELRVFDYVVHAVTYDDKEPWAELADGSGSSLEIVNSEFDPMNPGGWQARGMVGGTPGSWAAVVDSTDDWAAVSKRVGVAWRDHPVFGTYYVNETEYIYHRYHGWIYLKSGDVAGWWYDQDLGWMYTAEFYPYFYSADRGGWLYYTEGSIGPRWFYDYTTKKWLEV